MPQLLPSFNWVDFIPIVGLWFLTVLLSIGVLAWLFPRMERGETSSSSAQSDMLPWYPIPLRVRQLLERRAQVGPRALPTVSPAYWRTNVRLIVVLLTIWLAVSILPAIFSPLLNQIHILTGFPLGYYMGSQGALIVFIGIIVGYAWYMAKLDRRYAVDAGTEARPPTPSSTQLGLRLLAFTIGFILFIVLLGAIEVQLGLSANMLGWALLIGSIGLYAVIGLGNRAHSLDEYFVAGRRIPAFFNGMAIAGDWMSAATFVSMAGTLWLLGYDGLAYILGWTGGYVILVTLLAPYLRKFGQFGVTALEVHRVLRQLFAAATRQRKGDRKLLFIERCMPLGLSLLARQRPDLRLHFGEQVLEPLQIACGFFETSCGGVTTITVQADAGCFLEQRTTLIGPIGEEQVDHLRFDHHAGIAAEPGAPQQVLDVAQACRRVVEQIVALSRAREPPGDHHFPVRDREAAVRVLEVKRHFGDVHRTPGS
jgi:putative solute:sodium symporter small subunit